MPDFDLSITICSWNTLEDTRACLQSLADARDEANFEVIVVDNNSEDGSPDMIATEFPWVRLERMSVNLGFTGGHNHAMSIRRGWHAFLLNSDAAVHPGAIRSMLAGLESEPNVGILGPKILNPDGSLQLSCRRFPNPVAAMLRNTVFGRLFPNNAATRDYLMQDMDHSRAGSVDWVSGAAMLAHGGFIERVGMLDPGYFMYCEDVDWCWRAWREGYRVIYWPDALVTHAIGHSTDKAPNRMIGRHHRSMLRFYRINTLPTLPWIVRPFAMVAATMAILLRASLFIVKNKMDNLKRRLAK